MKAVLLAVAVLGFAGPSGAQTPQPALQFGGRADSVRVEGRMIHLIGNVEIRLGANQITAHEADVDQDTQELLLRGNVRIQPTGPKAAWTGRSASWGREADVMRLRGRVEITVGGMTFTADEADISDTGVANLRGNVRRVSPTTVRWN